MFVIFLTPASKSFQPHKWIEGDTFSTIKGAEFQAKQIRKGMKKEYTSVEIIPNSVLPERKRTANDSIARNLKNKGYTEEAINDHLQMIDDVED